MITITPDDQQFIEAHRHHYDTLIQAEFLGNLDGSVLNRMLEIIKKYFAPAYLANLWCQPCVADLVKYLYTQVDAQQAEPIIKHETFPKHDEPEHTVIEVPEKTVITEDTKIIDVPADTVITEPKKRGRKPKAQ